MLAHSWDKERSQPAGAAHRVEASATANSRGPPAMGSWPAGGTSFQVATQAPIPRILLSHNSHPCPHIIPSTNVITGPRGRQVAGGWQAGGRQVAGRHQQASAGVSRRQQGGTQMAGKWQANGRQMAGKWQVCGTP